MAMLHPDDEHYWMKNTLSDNQISSLFFQKRGSAPTAIVRPKNLSAAYHSVIFCRAILDSENPDVFSDVVLRVSRPCIPHIKTENEVREVVLSLDCSDQTQLDHTGRYHATPATAFNDSCTRNPFLGQYGEQCTRSRIYLHGT